jgi:hypothetical protein
VLQGDAPTWGPGARVLRAPLCAASGLPHHPLSPHSANHSTLTAGEILAVWGTLMIAMIGRTQLYEVAALAVFAAMVLVFTSQIVPALVD